MKAFFPMIVVSAFLVSGSAASAQLGSESESVRENVPENVTVKCDLVRAPDWNATLSIENGEITSIVYANQSGTIVSAPIAVSRSAMQELPGFVIFDVNASAPYELIAEEGLLTRHAGIFFFVPDSPELPPDQYSCN